MRSRRWALGACVIVGACASAPPAPPAAPRPPPEIVPASEEGAPASVSKVADPPTADVQPAATAAPRAAADPFGDVGFKEVSEKDWRADLRRKLAEKENVEALDLEVSPGLLRAAYVRPPAPAPAARSSRPAPRRRHEIVVVDNQGRAVARFRAVAARTGDEPPKDLRFLSEDRLVYEVVEPPPPPEPTTPAPPSRPSKRHVVARAKAAKTARPTPKVRPKPAAHPATPDPPSPPPARTFVIQPIVTPTAPIKCVGVRFAFSRDHDHLAFVAGSPARAFVAVDGAPVYPRRGGRTVVASAPAWSRDGRSLAFLEQAAVGPPRLVLVAELDNPTGDTTWDLPPDAPLDGVGVFWAGADKLVVGKTPTRPIFSSSFTKQLPGVGR